MDNVKCVRECVLSFISYTPTGLYTFLSIRTVLVSHRTFWRLLDYPPSPPTAARQNKNQSPPYEESTVDHWLHHYMLLDSKVFCILKTIEARQNRTARFKNIRIGWPRKLCRDYSVGPEKKKKKKDAKKEEKKGKRSKLTSYSWYICSC